MIITCELCAREFEAVDRRGGRARRFCSRYCTRKKWELDNPELMAQYDRQKKLSRLAAAAIRARNPKEPRRKYPPLSSEAVDRIIKLRKSGTGWPRIAKEFGIPVTTIKILARENCNDPALHSPAHPWHEDETIRAIELRKRGKNIHEIGRILKRSHRTVEEKLRRHFGRPQTHRNQAAPAAPEMVLQEAAAAYSSLTIGQLLLGDPPLGRSALDRRGNDTKRPNGAEVCVTGMQTAQSKTPFSPLGGRPEGDV